MPRFYPLEVTGLHRDTRDSVVVTLAPRPHDRSAFAFIPGQYLTFRRSFGDVSVRRCYSICTGADEGTLQVGIKRVEGGAFSSWANESLQPGAVLEAMPPAGRFYLPGDPGAVRHGLGFAGGSGITPILSHIRTLLGRHPEARFTLIYANRRVGSIMFRGVLDDLKDCYLDRLGIVHILEQEAQDIDLFTGRIDRAKCTALFQSWVDPARVDAAFVCGPAPMMHIVTGALTAAGLAADRIKCEWFTGDQPGRVPRSATVAAPAPAPIEVSVTLDGTTRHFAMARAQNLLAAALDNALDAPFACRAGVCATCRARLLDGEVEMAANHALEDYEVRAGHILTCQSYPLTNKITINYDT